MNETIKSVLVGGPLAHESLEIPHNKDNIVVSYTDTSGILDHTSLDDAITKIEMRHTSYKKELFHLNGEYVSMFIHSEISPLEAIKELLSFYSPYDQTKSTITINSII